VAAIGKGMQESDKWREGEGKESGRVDSRDASETVVVVEDLGIWGRVGVGSAFVNEKWIQNGNIAKNAAMRQMFNSPYLMTP